ncbi:hypothetical protein LAT59_01370 [Candidatus Gracilibacteria bacterium]|nr:hypothetical protein [Candidatus Gracilibacteria bacterium]
MINFNNIVKKLGNKGGKVMFKSDIYDIIDPEKKPEYQSQVDKIIYRLKAEEYIITLKAGVYVIPSDEDRNLNSIDLLEKYFLKLLKKYIISEVGTYYYIGGTKALEFHMKDYSLPLRISIINAQVQKKIKIGHFEIHFKILYGRKQGKKVKLFPQFEKYTQEKDILGIKFKLACLELALIESALIEDIHLGINIGLLSKTIKKYEKIFSYDIFYEIGKYKYNMAFNRLKELSKPLSSDVYQVCLEVIKKNGGCFVGEGLRNL